MTHNEIVKEINKLRDKFKENGVDFIIVAPLHTQDDPDHSVYTTLHTKELAEVLDGFIQIRRAFINASNSTKQENKKYLKLIVDYIKKHEYF